MALDQAHKGYEYQDLLSAYFILEELLRGSEAYILIDFKKMQDDRFDDLTIKTRDGVFRKQIKYSEKRQLEKDDLSSDSKDLGLDELYNSWLKDPSENLKELRICLAWDFPMDEITDVLIEVTDKSGSFQSHPTKLYRVNISALWPEGDEPIKNWRRFKKKAKEIDKSSFSQFCDSLVIEVGLPKFSLDILAPDALESLVLKQVRRIGAGVFPNHAISPEEAVLKLTHRIKSLRAKPAEVTVNDFVVYLGIVTGYGSISQEIPVNEESNVYDSTEIQKSLEGILEQRRCLLTAEPGAGKSWFVVNLEGVANASGVKIIKHYCFTELEDELRGSRITSNTFYGNLISGILFHFPDLVQKKNQLYASNLEELNLLLKAIPDKTLLIIDGLDHIERVYESHNLDFGKGEIDIIQQIGRLEFGTNVSCLVASQPISELAEVVGFSQIRLPEWSATSTVNLMLKYHLADAELESGIMLSAYLQERSEQNLLYLTYLIKEIKRFENFSEQALRELPEYSYNLSKYYEHLLTKLKPNADVPRILAGCSFRLTHIEFTEILPGIGKEVDRQLEMLAPILRDDIALGGMIVYHESFRRFIIDVLKGDGVDIEIALYRPLAEWLSVKDFYDFPKSYRFYLSVLIETKRYAEILGLITDQFVSKSLIHGHSYYAMKKNYKYFLMAVCEKQNAPKLITVNEISRTISSTEDEYYEHFELYFQSLGKLKGFKSAVDYLSFQGKPTLPVGLGVMACYECERNLAVAPWVLYDVSELSEDGQVDVRDFKYHVRHLFSNQNMEALTDLSETIIAKNLEQFAEVLIEELSSDEWVDLREVLQLDELSKLAEKSIPDDLLKVASEIGLKKSFSEGDDGLLRQLFVKAKELYADGDTAIVEQVESLFQGNVWINNWILFGMRIQRVTIDKEIGVSYVADCFKVLERSKEPPRPLDLFGLESVIMESLNTGLSYLSTAEEWIGIIDLLAHHCFVTTTYLQSDPVGPLSHSRLFKLLSSNANSVNRKHIIQTLTNVYSDVEDHHVHSLLAEYLFQLAILNVDDDCPDVAKAQFASAVRYLTGYTYRKDNTLSELFHSIQSVSNIHEEFAIAEVKELKSFAVAVANHTDGKGTSHYPITWYSKFLSISPSEAIPYLLNRLLAVQYSWILESDLINLLGWLGGKYPDVELLLSRTFPNRPDEAFQANRLDRIIAAPAYLNTIASAELSHTVSLVTSTRDPHYYGEFFAKLKAACLRFNLRLDDSLLPDVREKSSEYERSKIVTNVTAHPSGKLSELTDEQLFQFLSENGIHIDQVDDLRECFAEWQELTEVRKSIVVLLAKKERHYQEGTCYSEEDCFTPNAVSYTYYWMCRYVFDYGGWHENLVNTSALKKSTENSPNDARSFLFELLRTELAEANWRQLFPANLINAFVEADQNPDEIFNMWSSLKSAIGERLPFREEINWEEELRITFNMNEEQHLICILLTRFNSGGKDRFDRTLSSIQGLLFKHPEKMIVPLRWFFTNSTQFFKTSISCVLELLQSYGRIDQSYLKNFESEIKEMYPSRYVLIDYRIEQLWPDVFFKKLVIPKKFAREHDTEIVDRLLGTNSKLRLLNQLVYDLPYAFGLYSQIKSARNHDDKEVFWNRSHHVMSPNVFDTEYMYEALSDAFYSDLYEGPVNELNQAASILRFDVELIVSVTNSLTMRPDVEFPREKALGLCSFGSPEIEESWIRIGFEETEVNRDMGSKRSGFITYGGICFEEPEVDFVFSGYPLHPLSLWSTGEDADELDTNPVSLFQPNSDSLEDFRLMWLDSACMQRLGLIPPERFAALIAYDSFGNEALKFKHWKQTYVWNEPSLDSEYPCIRGSELLIKEDYFHLLCELYETLPKYYAYTSSFGDAKIA